MNKHFFRVQIPRSWPDSSPKLVELPIDLGKSRCCTHNRIKSLMEMKIARMTLHSHHTGREPPKSCLETMRKICLRYHDLKRKAFSQYE